MDKTAAFIWEKYRAALSIGKGTERLASRILPVRDFNNWVKDSLIMDFIPQSRSMEVSVLDMCCGKGGDLGKYIGKTGYLACVDIALESLVEAIRRYNGSLRRNAKLYVADFIWADVFATHLADHFVGYRSGARFDLISCQFALHYAFSSRDRASAFFRNISSLLSSRGRFIATFASKDIILSRMEAAGFVWKNTSSEVPPSIGNSLYRISFRKPFSSNPRAAGFGHEYYFVLEEAVDEVPEYFVDMQDLRELCSENGLRILHHFTTLSNYYDYCLEQRKPSLKRFESRMMKSSELLNAQAESTKLQEEDFFDPEPVAKVSPEQQTRSSVIRTINDIPESYRDVINLYQVVVLDTVQSSSGIPIRWTEPQPRRVCDIVNLTGQPICREDLRVHMVDYLWEPSTDNW